MSKIALKYREQSRFGSFYTGSKSGDSAVCPLTGRLFLICDDSIKILDQKTGQVQHTIEIEADSICSLTLSPDSNHLVCASKLGFLRQYTTTRHWDFFFRLRATSVKRPELGTSD